MNSSEPNLTRSDSSADSDKIIELYAHGKLLISGEYLVLDGAKCLAVPAKYGQHFKVHRVNVKSDKVYWHAYNYQSKKWLDTCFSKSNLRTSKGFDDRENLILRSLLEQCKKLNPAFLKDEDDILVECRLEFPNDWGLGSSSTLIYFLSQWAKIDPYKLLFSTMKGSGYDIACASSDSALFYQLSPKGPKIEKVSFCPPFKDRIHFVHLNQKRNSRAAILAYEEIKRERLPTKEIGGISTQLAECRDQEVFNNLIEIHEGIVSSCLGIDTLKIKQFSDFDGSIKSLGAWGGDFVMVSRNTDFEEFKSYFNAKGYKTILSFDEMVL
ncbi:MAG: GHMP kinase [Chitinophagales bacterium]|nr:GHMP kinase [Chitinophagales bacterium]